MKEVAPGVYKFELGDILGKPRMTQRDKFAKRPVAERYWAFKKELQLKKLTLPECGYHLICVIPMPKSWSLIKRKLHDGKPHQSRPDKDNIEKGVLDALYTDDSCVWDGRVSKYWGDKPCIYIKMIGFHATLEEAIGS